jgi:hypothetical protein
MGANNVPSHARNSEFGIGAPCTMADLKVYISEIHNSVSDLYRRAWLCRDPKQSHEIDHAPRSILSCWISAGVTPITTYYHNDVYWVPENLKRGMLQLQGKIGRQAIAWLLFLVTPK